MHQRLVEILRVASSCFALIVAEEASASYCTNTSVATLTSTPYATHPAAYDGLRCVEEHRIAAADRRAIFASVYTLTTLRMIESIDANHYVNSSWMRSYQTEFANHYRKALNPGSAFCEHFPCSS